MTHARRFLHDTGAGPTPAEQYLINVTLERVVDTMDAFIRGGLYPHEALKDIHEAILLAKDAVQALAKEYYR